MEPQKSKQNSLPREQKENPAVKYQYLSTTSPPLLAPAIQPSLKPLRRAAFQRPSQTASRRDRRSGT